jgi:hypothetical protein
MKDQANIKGNIKVGRVIYIPREGGNITVSKREGA